MPVVDLHFPVMGMSLPTDHGYTLYAAISAVLRQVHAKATLAIGPISGQYAGNGILHLDSRRSRLRLRLPAEQIATVLPLAGKMLDVAGHKIRLGVPQVRALVPAPNLIARMVTIKKSNHEDPSKTKKYMEPAAFLEAVQRELLRLGVHGEPGIPLITSGPRSGQLRRKILRIKSKCVVGFTLQVMGLTAEESIRLQENGLGGRRKMGCGFFVRLR
jgi:CRISPR-associated protein Cas6